MIESKYETWKKQREVEAIHGYPCKECGRRATCNGAGKCLAWDNWVCGAWRTVCNNLKNYAK